MVTEKNKVKGLTTAAGLWTCACVGLAIGIGFLEGAIVALVLIGVTLCILTKVDIWLAKYAKTCDLYIEFETNTCITSFMKELHEDKIKIATIEVSKSKIKGEASHAIVCINLEKHLKYLNVIEKIRNLEYVRYVEVL